MYSFDEQLGSAIAAHGQWKSRLRTAVLTGKTEFEIRAVELDNQCPFGKWLYSEGARAFRATGDFDSVKGLHAQFHKEAAAILRLATTGRKAEAEAALTAGSSFCRASSGLVLALSHVKAA